MAKKPVKLNPSALKRERQDIKRKKANHFRWHTMQTMIKRARKSQQESDFVVAQRHIAMNVKLNVIHKNAGSRLTSRLSKLCIASA